jgi:two-component system invasion response regulator UvrY
MFFRCLRFYSGPMAHTQTHFRDGAANQPQFGIVLVDDSDTFRSACQAALESVPGVRVIASAQDGPSALALVRTTPPDLVILDISMPGMGGLEVARQLKLLPETPPFVFLSMNCSPEYQQIASRMGAVAFISKKDLFEELLPLVSQLTQGLHTASPAHGTTDRGDEP